MPVLTEIRVRRGTAAQWALVDPVLAEGEPGVATDTGDLRFGDGSTPWSALPSTGMRVFRPEAFGAVGDGSTDDLAKFDDLVAALNGEGMGLVDMGGLRGVADYKLSAGVAEHVEVPALFSGAHPSLSRITGPGVGTQTLLRVDVGGFAFAGIGVSGFHNAIAWGDAAAIDGFTVQGCEFSGLTGRPIIRGADVALSNVRFVDNYVHDGGDGVYFNATTINGLWVERNHLADLARAGAITGIYVGVDTGDGTYTGTLARHVSVRANVIERIAGAGETHAIAVYCAHDAVSGNHIDTVETSAGDCEAIYSKAYLHNVTDNTIRNGGSQSGGAIQLKGTDYTDVGPNSPVGAGSRCSGNRIYEDRATTVAAQGISVYVSDCQVTDNYLKGCTGPSILLPAENVRDVAIDGNTIVDARNAAAILIRNLKNGIRVRRNTIRGMQNGAGGAVRGIHLLVASTADAMADVTITDNVIEDLFSAAFPTPTRHAIMLEISSAGSISDVVIDRNTISGVTNAVHAAISGGGTVTAVELGTLNRVAAGVTLASAGALAIAGIDRALAVAAARYVELGGAGGPQVRAGAGTPEGVVTAPVGSLFLRSDGGAATSVYVKESGAGNTGWVAK